MASKIFNQLSQMFNTTLTYCQEAKRTSTSPQTKWNFDVPPNIQEIQTFLTNLSQLQLLSSDKLSENGDCQPYKHPHHHPLHKFEEAKTQEICLLFPKAQCEKKYSEVSQSEEDQSLSQHNKRLCEYVKRMFAENKKLSNQLVSLSNQIPELQTQELNKNEAKADWLIKENHSLKADKQSLMLAIKTIVDILETVNNADQILNRLEIVIQELRHNNILKIQEIEQLSPLEHQQKLQSMVSDGNDNGNDAGKLFIIIRTFTDKYNHLINKMSSIKQLNQQLRKKYQTLLTENSGLCSEIKCLDKKCIALTTQYENNLEAIINSYEYKIKEIVNIITLGEYDQYADLIKSENKRLGLLLEEKNSCIDKLKVRVSNYQAEVEEKQAENCQIYSQLQDALAKVEECCHQENFSFQQISPTVTFNLISLKQKLRVMEQQLRELSKKYEQAAFQKEIIKLISEKKEKKHEELKVQHAKLHQKFKKGLQRSRKLEQTIIGLRSEFEKLTMCMQNLKKVKKEKDLLKNPK